MNKLSNVRYLSLSAVSVYILLLASLYVSCKGKKPEGKASSEAVFNESPVVPPEQSVSKMQVENGFAVKLIAAEPLLSTPIALTFDRKGRIWVLEMQDYMPDTLGTGEERPSGKIVILDDKNGDGVMDDHQLFLDSLVLPRALCLIENGILIAEPPYLWYYDIVDDKPVNKTLVDNNYATGGNVEHQPNGLYRALDNWIYNANSDKRYRKAGGKWLIQRARNKGQWGISQDDMGRLYVNDNSTNLINDYFPPSLGLGNTNQQKMNGFNVNTIQNNRVYPARPNTGVNRGYMKGILNDSLRLVNFTAACGPVIYRGGLFGKEYEFNAFVAEPAANLIKRDILSETGNVVSGKQAYSDKEFLASSDERFRPVSLYNGPDGSLYVVDMYRGIIQHKIYLTPYLKQEIAKRELTRPLTCGRLYKIYPKDKKPVNAVFPEDPLQLVALLKSNNGFVRDKAQQILTDTRATQAIPALQEALRSPDDPLQVIHALWTLEGLHALKAEEVIRLMKSPVWPVRMQALTVIPSVINAGNYKLLAAALTEIAGKNDTLAMPYVGFVAGSLQPFNKEIANKLMLNLVKKYPDNRYVADAVISNQHGREAAFFNDLTVVMPDTAQAVYKMLQALIADISNAKNKNDQKILLKQYPKGASLFSTVCGTCHGQDGNGLASLAPPLNRSEVVNGNKDILISIILKGLTGPVKVNGRIYKAPEISGEMPGFGDNKDFGNEEIAQVLNYIRGSWQNNGAKINAEDVEKVRKKLGPGGKMFTMKDFNSYSTVK